MSFPVEESTADAQSTLGVGLTYQKELHGFLVEHSALVDYLEIVPDTAWTDHGSGASPQYVDDAESLAFFRCFRRDKPVVAHSIGLSIGSAHRFRDEHLDQIRRWDALLDFPWHSDHLAFNIVLDPSQREYLMGVPFSVTLDTPMLELLTTRVRKVMSAIAKPFLLENNVSYMSYADQEFEEAAFLNKLCARSGCGLLLDLHNLYVNWRSGTVDLSHFLATIDLSRVMEVHLAGGLVYDGVYLDAHSGSVPKDVWRLAGDVVPACPNLRGMTFELLGSWFGKMGGEALRDTLIRMRELAVSIQAPVGLHT
jgi:uncharacterized protein (UPF0276 family)